MRSLWTLLILMAICSFVAQRKWRALFESDIYKALLQLPGNSDLIIVKAAQKAQPYNALARIEDDQKSKTQLSSAGSDSTGRQINDADLQANKQIDLVLKAVEAQQKLFGIDSTVVNCIGEQNEYNHRLDYYPNQLVYLLLGGPSKLLSSLDMRSELITYSLWSTSMTAMQFLLPWLFIGEEYIYYGWEYSKALLRYIIDQFRLILGSELQVSSATNLGVISDGGLVMSETNPAPNSIDYEISARIWPTLTKCEYSGYGLQGIEQTTVHCTVPINEICAKLFAVIWWFVVLNIVIEILALMSLVCSSIRESYVRLVFGVRFWPLCMAQADEIASFRIRYQRMFAGASEQEKIALTSASLASPAGTIDRKRLEAERDRLRDSYWTRQSLKRTGFGGNHYSNALRQIGSSLIGSKSVHDDFDIECGTKPQENSTGHRSLDCAMYYVFYLIYLRLNKNKKDVQQVILMTSTALNTYLSLLDSALNSMTSMSDSMDVDKPTGSLVSSAGKFEDCARTESALG